MKFFLIADAEKIWYIWPETNAYTVLQVLFFIFLFFAVIQIGRYVFLRKKSTSSSWTHILNYAYNKKLSSKEISVLEHFFTSLDLSVNEKANLLANKKSFQTLLYTYLKKYHSDSVESYVRILDKLFPTLDHHLEIKSILDVHVGEVCATEFDGLYFLARVMSKNETEIILSISDNAFKRDREGLKVNLYFYRDNLGGFLIPGLVKKVNANGILFCQEGDVQMKGEEHLVAELSREVELFPWGMKTQDASLSLHDNETKIFVDGENEEPIVVPPMPETDEGKEEEKNAALSLKGNMIRISDRAMLLNVKDPFFNEAVLRKIDIWEMVVSLSPGSQPLVLKGKIMRSDLFSESFIFKFVGPSESDMRTIFEEIKKHSPIRGFIS
ncbi:MAG: hypothetical protein KBF99_05020 [Leptospiraceae bacterium]|jgi:hypothetical protein|nr:hypothetical protein [Leptospiraceae bacterium]MBP9162520.1 hypothetical protein [Leptospiraceae bacterium]